MAGLVDEFKDLAVQEISKAVAESLFPDPLKNATDLDKIPERAKGRIDEARENRQQQIDNMADNLKAGVSKNFEKLKTNLNLLVDSAKTFVTRIGMIPIAIVNVTPVGPGASPNMILPMLEQLKSDARTLGKAYDDTETALEDLLMGVKSDSLPALKPFLTALEAALGLVAPMLAILGISRGGVEAQEDPKIESPVNVELKPTDCDNYEGPYKTTQKSLRSAHNCTAFQHFTKTGEELEDSDFKCENCKNFKK